MGARNQDIWVVSTANHLCPFHSTFFYGPGGNGMGQLPDSDQHDRPGRGQNVVVPQDLLNKRRLISNQQSELSTLHPPHHQVRHQQNVPRASRVTILLGVGVGLVVFGRRANALILYSSSLLGLSCFD